MTTVLDNFNKILEEFILKSISSFPEEPKIKSYYRMFEFSKKCNKQLPIKLFMGGCLEFKEQIKSRDTEFFMNHSGFVKKCVKRTSFTDDMGLRNNWEKLDDDTKKNVWDYIQTLYVLGETFINNDPDILADIRKTYETCDH